jgi:hypothetical protein
VPFADTIAATILAACAPNPATSLLTFIFLAYVVPSIAIINYMYVACMASEAVIVYTAVAVFPDFAFMVTVNNCISTQVS